MVVQGDVGLGIYLNIEELLCDVDVLAFDAIMTRCGPNFLLYMWK